MSDMSFFDFLSKTLSEGPRQPEGDSLEGFVDFVSDTVNSPDYEPAYGLVYYPPVEQPIVEELPVNQYWQNAWQPTTQPIIPALQNIVQNVMQQSGLTVPQDSETAESEQGGSNLELAAPSQSVIVDNSKMSPIERLFSGDEGKSNLGIELNPTIQNLIDQGRDFKEEYEGSPQQLANLEREFQESQERELDKARAYSENQLYSQYAMSGIDPNSDPLFQQNLDSIRSMDDIPSAYSDIMRRMTDGNGNIKANPFSWNLGGFTSQTQTPEAARNLYDFHFNQEDQMVGPRPVAYGFENGVVNQNAIDDGASPNSREALFMTGDQYIKYRNQFGLPGRDVKDIDPNEIYNKQDEQEQYGFIPYLTSEESVQRFHDEAAPHAASNLFNRLANFRRENTDFDVNYDGRTVSGQDLIRQGNLWWERNQGKAASAEPVTDPSQVTEDSVPYTYVLIDSEGKEIPAKSALVNAYIDEMNHPVMQFADGDIWTFDDMNDYNRSLRDRPSQEGEGDFTAYWRNLEPLVLDDGTKLRADRAEELLRNNNYENFSDFGPFNMNKPSIDDPFQDSQDNFNLNVSENSFLPWIVDTALGSIPYFFKPTAAAQGIANAAASYQGFQPGYQDFVNGTYSMLSDDPTQEERTSATLGSLIMPVTEHLFGLGSNVAGKGLLKLIGKNEEDIAPLIRYGMGAVGEGLEEIPGNIVEPIASGSGLSGWYANQLYRDANGNLTTEDTGNPVYNEQGRPEVDRDTDVVSRIRNFGQDIPLAFIGGATLGGTLGSLQIPRYRSEYIPRRDERREFGNVQERPGFNSNLLVGLTDEERDFYNR